MYLDKNKIYPLKNRHFSYKEALYQEAIIQLVYREGYERYFFNFRYSIVVITTAQRHFTKKSCS